MFPECLKLAEGLGLHENGDYTYPGNYRPISLLSSLSKVFEKQLYNQMINSFVRNDLLTPLQFGFGLTIRVFMQ